MLHPGEIIVDNFAGGGGASTGIFMALGRHPDHAINHDAQAVAMHAMNHPTTTHHCQSVWKADPVEICAGRPVGLAWFSPDCKHFSKAKGGKPVEKHIRDLAWVVVLWAQRVRPRVIALENVEEFKDWGPLVATENGTQVPCKIQKGQTFKKWVRELKRLGYKVEWRELRACDYGAPTIRKRLFVIARCDGMPIVWPEPTHGDPKSEAVKAGKLLPWRTAAEIIIWSLPIHSIFLGKEEARALGLKRPLADATQARIARGIKRYVLDAARPFIVPLTHQGDSRVHSIDEPARSVTGAHRGELALSAPVLSYAQQGGANRPVEAPHHTIAASEKDQNQLLAASLLRTDMASAAERNGIHGMDEATRTQTTANAFALQSATLVGVGGRAGQSRPRGVDEPTATGTTKADTVLAVPTLIQTGYGERDGQAPRVPGLDKPLGTPVAGGVKHAVAAAHLAVFRGDSAGRSMDVPGPTVTANSFVDRPGGAPPIGLVSATMIGRHSDHGTDVRAAASDAPMNTLTASGGPAVAAAFMAQHNAGFNTKPGRSAEEPVSTLAATGSQQQLVAAHLSHAYTSNTAGGQGDPERPAKIVTAEGNHHFLVESELAASPFPGRAHEVAAFLAKFYGEGGQWQDVREPTHTVPTRDRFALVTVDGQDYAIVDIGMRMLVPRELYRAQGFPDSYVIDFPFNGKPLPKDAQVRMCGNSVCPDLARAIVAANFSARHVITTEEAGAAE